MNLKNIKLFTNKSVENGPSSYEKRKNFPWLQSHKCETLEQSVNLRYTEVFTMDLIYGRRNFKKI